MWIVQMSMGEGDAKRFAWLAKTGEVFAPTEDVLLATAFASVEEAKAAIHSRQADNGVTYTVTKQPKPKTKKEKT
jgi:hypothetical protein